MHAMESYRPRRSSLACGRPRRAPGQRRGMAASVVLPVGVRALRAVVLDPVPLGGQLEIVPVHSSGTHPRHGSLAALGRATGVSETERLRFQEFAFERLASGRAALLRGGDGAGPGTGGAAEAGVRAAGRQSGPGVRCRRGDRVAVCSAGDARLAPGGGLSRRNRSTTRRGACGVERDQPYPWEFFRDPMTRTHGIRLLALVGAALGTTLSAACGGARGA